MCNCRICRYGREVQKHLDAIQEPHKEFFSQLYDNFSMVDDERDYLNMKLDEVKNARKENNIV